MTHVVKISEDIIIINSDYEVESRGQVASVARRLLGWKTTLKHQNLLFLGTQDGLR